MTRRSSTPAAAAAQLHLDEQVDAVFSSAVFHWVMDHDALFASLRGVLRPGGQLATQCGGAGNVAGFLAKTDEVVARWPYAPYFESFSRTWFFAEPGETTECLERAGFEDVRCWLEPWAVTPPEPAEFTRTICLGAHLELLPAELRDPFVRDVLALEDDPLRLGYVRLNIDAVAA